VIVLCCSAGFVTGIKIEKRINLKFVTMKKLRKELRDNNVFEDTNFTDTEKDENVK
jgi:hypothetical protein